MKNLMNLKGVKTLSKTQQKSINGGGWPTNESDCLACWGEWGGLCSLPWNSPCL